ncbi:ef-hand protein [Anaeramoeba flamelloides]|nr:ef-hand protein [Anaeramoeba flamelloides]
MSLTDFPKKELEKITECFNFYDRDADGKIDLEDIGKLARSLGRIPSEKELEGYTKKIKDEKLTQISLVEFLEILQDMDEKQEDIEELRKAFLIFDKKKNGEISVKEFKKILMNHGEVLSKQEINEIIQDFDPESDGVIDIDDFVQSIISNQN